MRPVIIGVSRARRDENHPSSSPTSPSTVSTPSKSPHAVLARSRPPLQARDSNAIMRVPQKGAPLSSRSANATTMPYDKPNNQQGNRPLMPTLGRTTKTPLTPRVAASNRPLSTPLRRDTRLDASPTPASQVRDDISTPVSSFLNSNITPRSSSRKSRVDSASSTPNGTPTGTSDSSLSGFDVQKGSEGSIYPPGLGITDAPKRLTVSFDPTSTERREQNDDSKFFFASDAKSVPQRQPKPVQKGPTFFYANGNSIPQVNNNTVNTGNVGGADRSQPKFFRANHSPEISQPPSKAPSSVSATSHATGRFGSIPPPLQPPLQHIPQRPASPNKNSQQSLRQTPGQPSPPFRPSVGRGQTAPAVISKRTSLGSPPSSSGHGRSASISSVEGSQPRSASQVTSIESLSPKLAPQKSTLSSNSLAAAIISTSVEIEESQHELEESPKSNVQSPTKTGDSLDHLNDLAANARRERKVLDLEITNSSLAAINRTLEREMRKQAAELRRFRRLSRSGRISLPMSDIRSSPIGASSNLSDMDEEDTEEESDLSEDSFDDEGSLSPSAVAASDERHRKRDEKRLQLDLSKHQQLLIDSQKMNQSLKRCLGWTEELIKEGNKALAYHVRVSDIELGGRVLAPDEVEERYPQDEGTRYDESQHPDVAEPLNPSTRNTFAAVYALMDDMELSEEGSGHDQDAPQHEL